MIKLLCNRVSDFFVRRKSTGTAREHYSEETPRSLSAMAVRISVAVAESRDVDEQVTRCSTQGKCYVNALRREICIPLERKFAKTSWRAFSSDHVRYCWLRSFSSFERRPGA